MDFLICRMIDKTRRCVRICCSVILFFKFIFDDRKCMKIKALFLFSVFMIVAGDLQAASQAHAPKKVEEQSAKAPAQVVSVQPEMQKSDCEQQVADSICWAMAAGAAAGVAWSAVDAVLARPSFQPTSPLGLTLIGGMRFILCIASLEAARNHMEQNQKTRLPRFFLYATYIMTNVAAGALISPVYSNVYAQALCNKGIPMVVPTSTSVAS